MIGWIAVVHAGSLDPSTVAAVAAEVGPEVERLTGRTFIAPPTVRVTTQQEAYDELRQARVAPVAVAAPGALEAMIEAERQAAETVRRSPAFFDGATGSLYVVKESYDLVLRLAEVPDAAATPVLRCVLAHELTHALQFDYVGHTFLERGQYGTRPALLEGHATWVSHRLCPAEADRLLRRIEGTTVASSRDPELFEVLAYTLGERFIDTWQARYGVSAVWWLLAQPPLDDATIRSLVEPGLLAGWREPDALAVPTARALGLSTWSGQAEPTDPYSLVELPRPRPEALAGLRSTFGAQGHTATSHAYRFVSAEVAGRWLAARRAVVDAGGPLALFSTSGVRGPVRPAADLRPAALPAGADAGFQYSTKMIDLAWYREAWVRLGSTVVGVSAEGQFDEAQVLHGLAAVAALPFVGSTEPAAPEADAEATLLRLAPPVGPEELRPSAVPPAVVALRLFGAQDWARCRAFVQERQGLVRPEHADVLEDIGAACAIASADLAAVRDVSRRFGPEARWDPLRNAAAAVMIQQGAPGEALKLLAAGTDDDPAIAANRAQLRLLATVAARRWGSLPPLLEDERIGVELRAQAALALVGTDSVWTAVAVLRRLCPEVPAGPTQVACRVTLDRFRR